MSMTTITVAINKGGTGKTMLVKALSKAATEAGYNVATFDLDSQRNLDAWGKRRKNDNILLPVVRAIAEQELEDHLDRAAKAGCDLAFVDTPPGKSTESLAAMEAADLIIMPFENDQDSYAGLGLTSKTAKRLGKTAYGILNKAAPNSIVHETTAAGVLKGLEVLMAPVVLHRYDIYRQSTVAARTVQELEPDGVPALEIAKVWVWLEERVQACTRAQLQKGVA